MNLNIFFRELTGIDYTIDGAKGKMVICFKLTVYMRGQKR
jgi:hypothetical protein